jgi:PKD repeat protein
MAKGRIVAFVIIGVMLLTVLIPGFGVVASVESPPGQPVNLSPDNATMEISPLHVFTANGTDDALCVQLQIVRSDSEPSLNADGSYDKPLWDGGLLMAMALPVGLLEYGQKCWWHVRVQDAEGAWSPWSVQTWFQVISNSPPNQPKNVDPTNEETGVSLTPILKASDFTDPDALGYEALNDTHRASRWQVRTSSGSYSSPVFDSGSVTTGLTSIIVTKGDGTAYLSENTTYYWHVRYRDSYDDFDLDEEEHWSAYSAETSFIPKSASSAPIASFSADKTEVTAGAAFVTFTDNSTPAGEITAWSWNFGDGMTENWTLLDRPSNGEISHKYTVGGSQTVKLTVTNAAGTDDEVKDAYVVVHAKPEASIGVLTAPAKAGEEITFMDNSSPTEDITSWEWQFDDGTTEQWTVAQRQAADGQIKHVFKKAGQHAVSLTVAGALGESYYNKQINVTGGGGFHFGLWMIGVALAAVVVVAGVVYLLRARKGK